jgi:uncharacterized protein
VENVVTKELTALWLLASATVIASAQLPPPPTLTGPVNDFANVIDATSERELERLQRTLQQATGDIIVVATVPTFRPYATIEEYTVKLFENGGKGIGERGKDNGLLIVVAVDDRRVRIEPGYEMEAFITDGYAGQTIREVMLPAFRTGQYGKGLVAGVTRLVGRIAEQRGVTLPNLPAARAPTSQARREPSSRNFPGGLVFFALLLLFILMSRRRRRRRRYWGGGPWSGWNSGVGPFGSGYGGFGGGFGGFGGRGGGGGGGFGGFGGGRSGGGGASGGW